MITPGKLFVGILNNRLQLAKECLSMGDPFQNGFKPNSGAIDNIFLLNGIIDKCKANGRPLYTCFIDFKSAFDLINRSALLFKLLNQGVHWEILVRDTKHVPKRDFSCEMGWPAWWNVWKYIRSSTRQSIKPKYFQFISCRPPRLSKYRKRCIYWRHTQCLSVVCWRSGSNVGEPNRFAKFLCGDNRDFTFNENKVPTSNTYNCLAVIFSNANDRFGENYENKHGKVIRAI